MSEPTGIFVVAPSTVKVNEEFSIGVKILTQPYVVGSACWTQVPSLKSCYNFSPRGISYMDNVLPDWDGTIEISGDESYEGPVEYCFKEGSGPHKNDKRPIRRIGKMKFTSPGIKFLSLKDSTTGILQTSNPIYVAKNGESSEKLFWGDIHSQTFFSDGLRCPEELYSFARDEAFLDIFALSDHSEYLTDRQWNYFVGVTNDFNNPGHFVTLIGQEWTSTKKCGHRNIYFPGNSGPIIRSNESKFSNLENVYEIAHKHKALVIPHHSANVQMGVDWNEGYDPEVERLVEIYSVWGNSERPETEGNTRPIRFLKGEKKGQHIIDALRLGHLFGFVGGGDIHDGRPGDELHNLQAQPQDYRQIYRQGIMGVWAKDLTRESIFDALWNRRVYATTNVRIFLRFSIAGNPMGSEIKIAGKLPISVEAVSEIPIARIDLVKNGLDYLHAEPDCREARWNCEDEPDSDTTWYYIRVTRQDGEMAWSTPIWVSR